MAVNPDDPTKNIAVGEKLHRYVKAEAAQRGVSLRRLTEDALKKEIEREQRKGAQQ